MCGDVTLWKQMVSLSLGCKEFLEPRLGDLLYLLKCKGGVEGRIQLFEMTYTLSPLGWGACPNNIEIKCHPLLHFESPNDQHVCE